MTLDLYLLLSLKVISDMGILSHVINIVCKSPSSRNIWSRFPDSNWGPTVYKTVALPTELKRHKAMWVGLRINHKLAGEPIINVCHPSHIRNSIHYLITNFKSFKTYYFYSFTKLLHSIVKHSLYCHLWIFDKILI